MVSQGPVNVHALEHLGTPDRGIVLFRRYVRRGIEAVQDGQDPHGFYMNADEVPPTFANDYVCLASEIGENYDDPAAQRAFMEKLPDLYRAKPPMTYLKQGR
jgi:hypothetical protein